MFIWLPQVLVEACGLNCSKACENLVLLPGIKLISLKLITARRMLNHWTTRGSSQRELSKLERPSWYSLLWTLQGIPSTDRACVFGPACKTPQHSPGSPSSTISTLAAGDSPCCGPPWTAGRSLTRCVLSPSAHGLAPPRLPGPQPASTHCPSCPAHTAPAQPPAAEPVPPPQCRLHRNHQLLKDSDSELL